MRRRQWPRKSRQCVECHIGRRPVKRTRLTKLQTKHIEVGTDIKKIDGRVDVVSVVLDWLLTTLADSLVSSNVDDTPDAALALVGLEDLVNVFWVCDVSLEDFDFGSGLVFF